VLESTLLPAGPMAASSIEYNYKVILLGGVGVGKTSLFNRIKTDEFQENATGTARSTVGSDVYNYSTTIGEDQLNVSCILKFVQKMVISLDITGV